MDVVIILIYVVAGYFAVTTLAAMLRQYRNQVEATKRQEMAARKRALRRQAPAVGNNGGVQAGQNAKT